MGAVKKTGIIKSPGMDADANLKRAREYNRKHPYKEPSDWKAAYKTISAGGYPCLVIRQRHTPPSGKAILFLHGRGASICQMTKKPFIKSILSWDANA